jgi:spermidine synthase
MSIKSDQWFSEIFGGTTAFSVLFSKKLYESKSLFQNIEVYETPTLGRVLILDGCFMVSEADGFIYHEMLVHPAMATVGNAKKVLVIGGGDGGAVTEIVKYPDVESCTLCEIDPMVVEVCREFFPHVSSGLSDPRVKIVNEDGAKFIQRFKREFDVVLVDSTDPVGPGEVLFQEPFYLAVKESLCRGGAAVFQTESPLFMRDVFVKAVKGLNATFGRDCARPFLSTIPSYPGALWSFTLCSEAFDPAHQKPQTLPSYLSTNLNYYNPEIHFSAFALPQFVRKMLAG